jgi:imidazolonepropionase-like amidohydrolase
MVRQAIACCGLLALIGVFTMSSLQTQASQVQAAMLYEGARLIPGDAQAPIDASAFLVEKGVITRIGRKGEVTAPAGAARVDLTGKTVMPTIIDTHGHPGFQKGLTYTGDNFTRESIVEDLNRGLYFGLAVLQSQGIEKGEALYQVRADQQAGRIGGTRVLIAGRGIGAPKAGPGAAAYAGIAYEITTEAEARRAVQELAARKVDLIKIWVDDRNGRAPRLSGELSRAVIEEGHAHGLKVNAHVFYHTDTVELVNAGIDGLAHMVRDKEMDAALIASIVKRNVYVMPNLGGMERQTYAELPPWLKDEDPLFGMLQATVAPAVLQRMRNAYAKVDANAIPGARERYAILQRSLAKLSTAGARIILGSDTGLEDHFFGFAEHRELALMVEAGMTPAQVIVAATSRPAEYLGLKDTGSLVAGKSADFLVLDANPLDDIRNTRRISKVYLKGVEVDRAALSAVLR